MSKAEEFLKKLDINLDYAKSIKVWSVLNFEHEYSITELMEQYADEVSRELAKEAYNYGYDAQISYRKFNEWWKSKQEEK